MSVKIIVAVGNWTEKGYPIGVQGKLPWCCRGDMEWFKFQTLHNVVIMGRKTYESIGHPLVKRINFVVSKTWELPPDEGVFCLNSLERCIKVAELYNKDIFIIGGSQLYNYALEHNLVDEVLINALDVNVNDADTFFPKLDSNIWKIKQINYCPEMCSKIIKYVKQNG